MTLFRKIKQYFKYSLMSLAGAVKSAIGIRDIFVFGGLGMLGYGLYLFTPWIAFVVCGSLLMEIGLFLTSTHK